VIQKDCKALQEKVGTTIPMLPSSSEDWMQATLALESGGLQLKFLSHIHRYLDDALHFSILGKPITVAEITKNCLV
jgi:hypothetical protein